MEIEISKNKICYEEAIKKMEKRVNNIILGKESELIWCLEHENIYTAGTSTKKEDLKLIKKAKVIKTGRGGQITYHGPGQKIIYIMINLLRNKNTPSIKRYIWQLESLVINALEKSKITCSRNNKSIGVWSNEKKIASIGIRIRKWIAFHGIAININPDKSYFENTILCGLPENSFSSVCELYSNIDKKKIELDLINEATKLFTIV